MDLLDFDGQDLYFDGPANAEVDALIADSADAYGDGDGEAPLLKARELAPDSLTVMVALYRFYYYQHRLEDALKIADEALALTAAQLDLPLDWSQLSEEMIGQAAVQSMTLLRFHLLALKASGYLLLRMRREDEGKALLRKLSELDSHNRLGVRQILDVVETRLRVVS